MKKHKKHPAGSPFKGMRARMSVVALGLLVFSGILVVRLFNLQIIQHEALVAQSEKQYLRTIEIHSGRGDILDRNGNLLATNLDVESVYIDAREIHDRKNTERVLSRILGISRRKVAAKIATGRHFVWIKRKCDLDKVEKLKQLGLPGVGFVEESRRFYPKRELAASTIGFVGLDNQGLAGIEHYHDSDLRGAVQRKVVEKDARGRYLLRGDRGKDLEARGKDVILTIDEVVQFTAERALKKQVEKYGAKNGLAIVMDPANGEIFALATLPEFNPNNYSAYPARFWRNDAVSLAYEPGSIFKPILAAAILDAGVARPNDIFFCENGKYRLAGVSIGEAANHKFGWLSLQNIIAKSSNIGAIKVAQELGEERFYQYIRRFGFGRKVGIDLPGEAAGKLRELSEWSGLSLASISFGHEISTTPLQMVMATAAIANGGFLVPPHVTKALRKNGNAVEAVRSRPFKRVISGKTSRRMIDILKVAVAKGTGGNAALDGYDVAGKTGTAQKIDPETQSYSKTAYISSFVGFVPANAPRLVILVMIDEPQKSYWGGEVAAPVFREIAQKTLRHLNIPSSRDRVYVLDRT